MKTRKEIAVLLHNIRSTHNVGSIFRTADALGISKIYISGYTPTPLDKFNRPRKDIAKTALGAEKTIGWVYGKTPEEIINKLSVSFSGNQFEGGMSEQVVVSILHDTETGPVTYKIPVGKFVFDANTNQTTFVPVSGKTKEIP